MMKSILKLDTMLFLIIEVGLLVSSQVFNTTLVDIFHYSCVVLCLIYGVGNWVTNRKKEKRDCFIVFGLAFTSIADYYLILQNNNYEIGVIAFGMTQICYNGYLTAKKKLQYRRNLCVIQILVAGLTGFRICVMQKQCLLLFWIVSLYVTIFISNLLVAIKAFSKQILFTIGLILFFMCDLCVGLSNAELAGIQIKYQNIYAWLIWIFYIPSQVCISLFLERKRLEK